MRVPMETNSPKMPMGKIPARTTATAPVIIVLTYGVLNL